MYGSKPHGGGSFGFAVWYLDECGEAGFGAPLTIRLPWVPHSEPRLQCPARTLIRFSWSLSDR